MQHAPPEPKRSKDAVAGGVAAESPEAKSRRLQRELMAAAAEKRMSSTPRKGGGVEVGREDEEEEESAISVELSLEEVNELFDVVFGGGVSKGILARWSNQGIRYFSVF